MTKARVVSIVILAVAVGAVAGVASAADVTVPGGQLDVGSAAVSAPSCSAAGATFTDVRTVFDAMDKSYRIGKLTLDPVTSGCRDKSYVVATTDDGTVKSLLAQWTGTTPDDSDGTLTPVVTSEAADVNSVTSANEEVRLYLIVKG